MLFFLSEDLIIKVMAITVKGLGDNKKHQLISNVTLENIFLSM